MTPDAALLLKEATFSRRDGKSWGYIYVCKRLGDCLTES